MAVVCYGGDGGFEVNIWQKLMSKLFGFDYVVKVWKSYVFMYRAKKLGRHWVIDKSTRIYPGGKFEGDGSHWEPLTAKVKRFYDAEVI